MEKKEARKRRKIKSQREAVTYRKLTLSVLF
jgi:hypothetical protein